MENEDKALSIFFFVLYLLVFAFVVFVVDKWREFGRFIFEESLFFIFWTLLLILGGMISVIALYSKEYRFAFYVEIGFLALFGVTLVVYMFFPLFVSIVVSLAVLLLFASMFASGGSGGSVSVFDLMDFSKYERSSSSDSFETEAERSFFPFLEPHVYRIKSEGDVYEGFGKSKKKAKEDAIKKMKKSSRFSEKRFTNLISQHISSEGSYYHEITDAKTKKTALGRGNNYKEAEERAWHKITKNKT
jgi:hypothetical protein